MISTFRFLARALHFITSAVETPSQDVRLLIRTLKQLGATLVVDQEFANKRILVFNSPKVRTGEFPFRFFRVVETGGRKILRPSKAVTESFKGMGYKFLRDLGRGQEVFTKEQHRVQIGASHSGDYGDVQGLIVSFEFLPNS